MKLTPEIDKVITICAAAEGRTKQQMLYMLLGEGLRFHWEGVNDATFGHLVKEFDPDAMSVEMFGCAFDEHRINPKLLKASNSTDATHVS